MAYTGNIQVETPQRANNVMNYSVRLLRPRAPASGMEIRIKECLAERTTQHRFARL